MTLRLCPHCGYDLEHDTPVLINDFSMMGSMGQLWWCDQQLNLTNNERMICYTLMKAYPGPVTLDALLQRLGSEAESEILTVYICRIRKKLRDAGAPDAIMTMHARGYGRRSYSWKVEMCNAA